MPLLAGLFVEAIGAFSAWLLQYCTQKIAVTLAFVSLTILMMSSLYSAMQLALAGAYSITNSVSPMFGAGVQTVISPRVASLLSSYLTFWAVVELYKWKTNLLQLWARTI